MNNWQMRKRAAVALIFSGLMTIAPSLAQRPAGGKISGHVVDEVGATIPRASVFVHRNSPSEDTVRLVAHTDLNGDFMLFLPKGGYDVLVTAPGFASGVESLGVFPGKTTKAQWKLKVLPCDFPGRNCDTFQ